MLGLSSMSLAGLIVHCKSALKASGSCVGDWCKVNGMKKRPQILTEFAKQFHLEMVR